MNIHREVFVAATFALGAVFLPQKARAALPPDSPLRLHDCVPVDDLSFERLKVLRGKVRGEFARLGGAVAKGSLVDEWGAPWGATDDWTLIVDNGSILGLDSPRLGMAAMIPRAWTQPASATKAGTFDPVADAEAARALVSDWVAESESGVSYFHPRDWGIRVSSPSDLGEGTWPTARFYFGTDGTPLLRIGISTRATRGPETEWFASAIGHAILEGYSPLGRDGVSLNGRRCRVIYLEREAWREPKDGGPLRTARTILGCHPPEYSEMADDLLVTIDSPEYPETGKLDINALSAYDVARRGVCTIRMTSHPLLK